MTGLVIDSYRFAVAGVDSPDDIAGLAAWYDASDAGSITESSGNVSQWNDLSGNARHLAQSNLGNKPGTGAQTQNGLNVLTWDGSDFMRYDAGSDAMDFSPIEFFIVARYNASIDAYSRLFSLRQATATEDYLTPNMTVARQNADSIDWNSAGTAVGTAKAYTDDTMFLYNGRNNGSTSYHSINGGAEHSASASPPSNMRYINVGSAFTGTNSTDQYLTGRIAEIVIYNATLTSDERTAILSYLNTKWAVY
jgi:hypothetical protein